MSRRRSSEWTQTPADLRAIARYQRLLILCLLTHVLVWVGYVVASVAEVVPDDSGEGAVLTFGVSTLVGVVGGVLVFLLATKLSGPVLGAFLGLLTLVPCLGLVVLMIVSVQATGALTAHGVRVGLIGAKRADLAKAQEQYERTNYEYPGEGGGVGEGEDEGW